MRTVSYGGANSLDNFIAGADHGIDWILWCDEAAEYMSEYWATIDTVLMGRKTYEVAMKNAPPDAGGYPGVTTYVFSKTLPPGPVKGGTVIGTDAVEFVRDLKAKPGKGICLMGGGELARPLLEAGLVDEVGLNIHPVILGSGVPLFHPMTRRLDLELKECKQFKNGCVLMTYRVRHGSSAGVK